MDKQHEILADRALSLFDTMQLHAILAMRLNNNTLMKYYFAKHQGLVYFNQTHVYADFSYAYTNEEILKTVTEWNNTIVDINNDKIWSLIASKSSRKF